MLRQRTAQEESDAREGSGAWVRYERDWLDSSVDDDVTLVKHKRDQSLHSAVGQGCFWSSV